MKLIIASILLCAGVFTSSVVRAQARYNPQPLVIVADDETPLDEGPLAHLDALVTAGGYALDNTALLVNGAEGRRLASVMPLAQKLMSYQRLGLTIFVCKDALDTQRRLDGLPLLPGIRALPDDTLPNDIASRFNAHCNPTNQVAN